MDVATWNVLHDGRIVLADGIVPGDIWLSVEIAYLCGHLQTSATCLFVDLRGCVLFEYRPYNAAPVVDPRAVASLQLEILSAGLNSDFLSVECADGSYGGQLHVQYKVAETRTGEGQLLSQAVLESAAEEYWAEWSERNNIVSDRARIQKK